MDARCPNCSGMNTTKVWAEKSVLTFVCNECGTEFEVACAPESLSEEERTAESIDFIPDMGYSAEIAEHGDMWLLEVLRYGEHVAACWCGSRSDAIDAMNEAESIYWGLSVGDVFESATQRMTVSGIDGDLVIFEEDVAPYDRMALAVSAAGGAWSVEHGRGGGMSIGDSYVNARGFRYEIVGFDGDTLRAISVVPGNSTSVTESAWKVAEFASMLRAYGYEKETK